MRAFSRSARSIGSYLRFLRLAWLAVSQERHGVLELAAAMRAVSRIMWTITMFLPIKLLIMMEGQSTPKYIAFLLNVTDRAGAMTILIACVPLFYAGHMLLDAHSRRLVRRHVDGAREQDGTLDDRPIAAEEFRLLGERISEIEADVLVVVLSLATIFAIGWVLGVLLAVSLVVLALSIEYVQHTFPQDRRLPILNVVPERFMDHVFSLLYIVVFVFVLLQMAVLQTDVYLSILSLLMARMAIRAMGRFFGKSKKLRESFAVWLA